MTPGISVELVDRAETRELRRRVLRPSWPPGSAMHGDDQDDALHLATRDADGAVIGTCVLLPGRSFPPRPDDGPAWQLRGMATADGLRGRGIGAAVLGAALELARERGAAVIWCEARTTAMAFYLRHGFAVEGAEYLPAESGLPHHLLWRRL